ncbi:MAG TPA: glycosyltransferase family 2 protein [Candidatus Thermoplasmatota archaeon]|nr:glycosyltransferase family 2 protein [Candidatus Thermoplasmatota archaeon]
MAVRPGRVCVLVLNWRQAKMTEECVRSILAGGFPARDVAVVDNGSGDGSAEALAAALPEASHLALPENLGYAGGNNRAIERALARGYEHVLVLNNDTLVPPGTIERLLAEMDADPGLAAVQPRVVAFDGRTIENAGGECDRQGATWPRGRGEDPARSFPRDGFLYASGACVLLRAEALRTSGAFDGRYFMYHEDADLGWRLLVHGWRLALVDDARCLHAESTTAGASPRKIGIIWRNRFATLLKNYGAWRASYRVPRAVLGTLLVACGVAARQRDWRYPWLWLKAVAWNARHLRSTLRERRRVQRLRKVPDREIERFFCPSVEWRMLRSALRR